MKYLTTKEVAGRLKVSRPLLRQLSQRLQLPRIDRGNGRMGFVYIEATIDRLRSQLLSEEPTFYSSMTKTEACRRLSMNWQTFDRIVQRIGLRLRVPRGRKGYTISENELAMIEAAWAAEWLPPQGRAEDHELAWLAGIIDGEAHIGVTSHLVNGSASAMVRLAINNTIERLIDRVEEIYLKLNLIYGRWIQKPENERRRLKWIIYISQAQCALALLRAVRPYIAAKQEVVDIVIQFCGIACANRRRQTGIVPRAAIWAEAALEEYQGHETARERKANRRRLLLDRLNNRGR